MQNRKELLKQTFKDWKLLLNDDKWEHIVAENDPEERKKTTAEENGQGSKNSRYSSERVGYVSSRSEETAHGGKKSMVQVVKETSFMGPLKKK